MFLEPKVTAFGVFCVILQFLLIPALIQKVCYALFLIYAQLGKMSFSIGSPIKSFKPAGELLEIRIQKAEAQCFKKRILFCGFW